MTRKWWLSLGALGLAAVCLAQPASELQRRFDAGYAVLAGYNNLWVVGAGRASPSNEYQPTPAGALFWRMDTQQWGYYNGSRWTISPLGLPKTLRRDFTVAETGAIFGAPLEILPAKAGVVYWIDSTVWMHPAGSAWTCASQTVDLKFASTPVSTAITNINQCTGFLDQSTEMVWYRRVADARAISEGTAYTGGKAVQVSYQTSNPTNGNFGWTLIVYYYELPTALSTWSAAVPN